MPWSGSSFRKKNSSLSAVQAGKAAKQANAILAKTGDEGLAIAVANKNAGKSHKMYSAGGKITRVAGKHIGKDDGLIAAQKGEYVIRKSAVKKLGTAVLDEVNKGRLPSAKLYSKHKAAA